MDLCTYGVAGIGFKSFWGESAKLSCSACTVAIIRINYAFRDLSSVDRSWEAGKTFLWRWPYPLCLISSPKTFFLWQIDNLLLSSILEINTGLICSCTPAFKPFFKHLVSRPFFLRYVRLSRGSRLVAASIRNLTSTSVAMSQEAEV